MTTSVNDSGLIQFSGILLTSDSLYPVPFANIYVQKRPYGTYSNLEGYFSFVARKGDTIVFSHVEFKRSTYVIPDTLTDFKYSIVKLLTQDTVNFPGVVVMPMPNRATFDHKFVTNEIPNDDIQRAKNNLEREALKEQAFSMTGSDASEAYKQITRMYAQKSYYAGGQIPPMNILNPFAWAQFFEAWKRGDFKRKK
ncbi:MAG: carboxypeptidase-like regulatory domain-containing protein [Bacteroidia bacterium]